MHYGIFREENLNDNLVASFHIGEYFLLRLERSCTVIHPFQSHHIVIGFPVRAREVCAG